jgi:predicted Zn-dependent peptidase
VAFFNKVLPNGLTVLVEEMDHVASVSYEFSVPGGFIADADDRLGQAVLLADVLCKGAGQYDSRQLSNEFDQYGIRHGEGCGLDRFTLAGSAVGANYKKGLALTSSMIRAPQIPHDDIGALKSILLQDLASLRDNPARRAMVELSRRFHPAPFNRTSLGSQEGIDKTDREQLTSLHSRYFRPQGSIVSVAGNVKAQEVFDIVEELFEDWAGEAPAPVDYGLEPREEYYHIDDDSAQLQIVMANRSVPFGAPLYYEGKLVASLLGSSMFGRLFMEVREKRGLCYSVYARHGSRKEYGTITAYVGTTADRAQESLDVMLGEFRRLRGSIEDFELERARTNLKASLIMGEEAPASRASSNASDWWLLSRVRPLTEIHDAIDRVSIESIESFLEQYPFMPCSILTLGSKRLEVDGDVVATEVTE